MQTSYEVGAVFRLLDEVSPTIRVISERMSSLTKIIDSVQKSFNKLGQTKVGEVSSSLRSVEESLKKVGFGAEGAANKVKGAFQGVGVSAVEAGQKMAGLELAVRNLGENTTASFEKVVTNTGRADGAIKTATEAAKALSTELRAVGAASQQIPRLPGSGRQGLGNRGGSGGGGGGGGSTPGSHSGGSSGHAAEVGMNLGMLGSMGFSEVKDGFAHIVEAGARLEKFQAQLQAATNDMAKVADATAAAWAETGKNLTTNVSDNLKNLQHLMNVVGSLDEAKTMLHSFTLADTALSSIKDDSVAGGKGSKSLELNAYNVARSLEQLGVTQDEEKLQSYTASITRMMVGMRGLVDGSKLYNTINNAGGSRYAWDQDFVTYGLGPLAQATNGRAGAQLYQLNRSFYQGVSTKMMAEGAEKYGLWNEGDEVYEGGKFKGMKVGSVFEADKLMHNPVEWAGDVREMMRKRGINVDDTDTMTGVVAEATRGNKNLGAIMDELILPKPYAALMNERTNIKNVPEDAVSILQKRDPGLAMKAFSEQFENLLTALGKPNVSQVADTLNRLAGGINSLAQWSEKNPTIGRVLVEGMTAVGAALGVLTGVGILAALALFLPGGAFALGAAAVVGVLTDLAVFHWDTLTKGLDVLKSIPSAIAGFFTDLIGKLRAIPGIGRFFTPSDGRTKDDAVKGAGQYDPSVNPFLFSPTAFGSNDNNPMVDLLAQGVFKGLQMYANGGSSAGMGGGGGGGIVNASWGGGGLGGGGGGLSPLLRGRIGGGGGGGGGSWTPSASDPTFANIKDASGFDWSRMGAQMGAKAAYLGAHLRANGASEFGAAAMLGHASVESNFKVNAYNGRLENSHGLFQWNDSALAGHRWSKMMAWARATGRNPNDPLAQLDYAKVESMHMRGPGGQSVWDAMQHAGSLSEANRIWMDYFENPKVKDYGNRLNAGQRALNAMRTVAPPPARPAEIHVHTPVHLDGKQISSAVTKRQVRMARFPTAVGGIDGHGSFASPSTPLSDVA